MVNDEMARNLIANAELYLGEARAHFDGGHWHVCVRRSQEAIEAAAKAALRVVGVEPPRLHDVSEVLGAEASRFPDWFRERLPEVQRASKDTSKDRERSYYGDERLGIPPSRLYDRAMAEAAQRAASEVFALCSRLIEELAK